MKDNIFKLDAVKKFLEITAALASVTVLLYAAGYMADYAHDHMLGISGFQPDAVYYLVTGGTFFISTLYALYTTLVSHFYYFILFFLVIAAILLYEDYAGKKKITHMPKLYAAAVGIVIFIYLWLVIPVFTSTFAFKDMLLAWPSTGPDFYFTQFNRITGEMWTWILNGGNENMRKLTDRYVLLILSTIISAIMLYSMRRQWLRQRRQRQRQKKPPHSKPARSLPWTRLLQNLRPLPGIAFALLFLLMLISLAVQIVTIPMNYGIMVKTNHFPEVKLEIHPGNPPGENLQPPPGAKVWLLKENQQQLLLYAVFIDQNSGEQTYKLYTLKKDRVAQMEILPASFVFKYK